MITDIKCTLVIGSGPIVIGQAAEFDYGAVKSTSISVAFFRYLLTSTGDPGRSMNNSFTRSIKIS